MPGWLNSAGSGPLTWMLSNATSTTWILLHQKGQRQRKVNQGEDDAALTANVTKEKRNENKSDQCIRGRPGQGPALLYRGSGLCQEDRFQSGPISLADRGFARGARRHGAAARAEQQPGGQSLPAGSLPTKPARGHVLHRRRAGRLRTNESARRRVHHATQGRDRLQDRHAEGHLRQCHSSHPVDALVVWKFTWIVAAGTRPTHGDTGAEAKEQRDDQSRAVLTGSGKRCASTKRRREMDAHSRQGAAPLSRKSLASANRPGASARVGALRRRWKSGYGWSHGEAHHRGSPRAPRHRDNSDASRCSRDA